MDADIKGALAQINRSWRAFVHNGSPMSKKEVKAVLEYGVSKGYTKVSQLSEQEINSVINNIHGTHTNSMGI